MTGRTGDSAHDREEIQRAYAAYRRSARKRRSWDRANPGNQAIRGELVDHVMRIAGPELRGQAEILDAGCGTGWWLRQLAQHVHGARLHGVDILGSRLAAAELPPAVRLREADVRALPYTEGRFGLVLLFTVLSSLPSERDVQEALHEVRRVLAPGGLLLVYEPRVPNVFNRRTRRIRRSDLSAVLGPPEEDRAVTLLPALARHLGRATPVVYPRAARIGVLCTHRLAAHRRPADH